MMGPQRCSSAPKELQLRRGRSPLRPPLPLQPPAPPPPPTRRPEPNSLPSSGAAKRAPERPQLPPVLQQFGRWGGKKAVEGRDGEKRGGSTAMGKRGPGNRRKMPPQVECKHAIPGRRSLARLPSLATPASLSK